MEFWQSVLVAVLAAALTIPASIIVYRKTRPTREVYYTVSSTALVDPDHFSEGPLYVSVDRSQIEGAVEDSGTLEKVEAAYVFGVRVRNTGSETVDDLSIRLELDEGATPVRYRGSPPSGPGYKVSIVPDKVRPGRLTFLFPYINPDESAYAEVLSIGNETDHIDVAIRAHNVRVLTFDEYFDRKYPFLGRFEKWVLLPMLGASVLLTVGLLVYLILAAVGAVPPLEGEL